MQTEYDSVLIDKEGSMQLCRCHKQGSDDISASPVTTFPNSGWSGEECPLLKAPVFALPPWWIRKTDMSAV